MVSCDVEDEEEYGSSYTIIHDKCLLMRSSYVWYMYIHACMSSVM
jgi:hypothetical protein